MPYVPIEWLREHVDVPSDLTAEQLAFDLVKIGLEEEGIVPPAVTGPLVVGKVLTQVKETASNGKTINYCRVDVGPHNDEPGTGKEPSELPSRGIICGAHNFEVGDSVVVSLPGAVLPGDFRIAARKTYGHVSDGMICSAAELGMETTPEDESGIIVLDRWLPAHGYDTEALPEPGTDAISLLGLGEEVLEINITPDRGYCFSMRGVAREYSHSTGALFTDLADGSNPGLFPNGVASDAEEGFPVTFAEDTAPIHGKPGVTRYVARVVRGINPSAPTPRWMKDRLTAAGMRPISLAVDVTNYVMLDLGQPLHAFDLAKVSAPLVVRRAQAGETLTFLDEVTRTLDAEDLVIADSPDGEGSRPLVLAGVFGGADAEVDATTTDILIEAAHFDEVSIALSARRHKLPTESSKRNERGVDTALPPVAAQRAVDLLVEYGGGTADPSVTDLNKVVDAEPILLRADLAERLTGVAYGTARVTELLETIGCTVEPAGTDEDGHELLRVAAPTWRPDLTGPAHFVEEVARLDGYDNIPTIVPTAPAGLGLTPRQRMRRSLVEALAFGGFTQVLSYPFIGDIHDRMGLPEADPRRRAMRLSNPLQEDAPLMRTSIVDSLFDVARRNVSRGLGNVALFEMGLVTLPEGTVPAPIPSVEQRPSEEELAALEAGIPDQPLHVGLVLTGEREPEGVLGSAKPWEWSDAVQAARTVASTLGVAIEVSAPAETVMPWHPGRTAEIRLVSQRRGKDIIPGALVGYAGELHPRVLKDLGLPARACAVELNLEPLLAAAEAAGVLQVKPVLTFPPAKEDLAFVVDEAVTAGELETVLREALGASLEEIRLFDVFRGPQLGAGKKSLAFSLRLRADHTLTAEETAGLRKRAVSRAAKRLGAELRA